MMSPSDYAKNFIGTNYTWGGKTPQQGFDCSGLVSEALKACGKLPNKALLNSQNLFRHYSANHDTTNRNPEKDAILFFGKSVNSITHVALAVDHEFMIEAGGEGREETDKGSVRIRPIKMRKDLVAAICI